MMYDKKLLHLLCAVVLLSAISTASAGLVAYYPFDGNAKDVSGVGDPANGTMVGDPTFEPGPDGFSQAIRLDGSTQYVDCGNAEKFNVSNITIMCWVKVDEWNSSVGNDTIIAKGGAGAPFSLYRWSSTYTSLLFGVGVPVGQYTWAWGGPNIADGQWHHIVGTYDGATILMYIDGVVAVTSTAASGALNTNAATVWIGNNSEATDRFFNGWIDDVRIYDEAVGEEEVEAVMQGAFARPYNSRSPSPSNLATDVLRTVDLSWTAGKDTVSHDVYFGTDSDAVDTAGTDSPLLISSGLANTTYDFPSRLELGQTYYWRVDEVNSASPANPTKGDLWSFTVEPVSYLIENIEATASVPSDENHGPEKLIDGSGMTDGLASTQQDTMWFGAPGEGETVSLQFDFDRAYKLHQVHIWNYNLEWENMVGFGLKEISIEATTDGETWTPVGDFELEQGPGAPYAGQILDLGGAAAKSIRINALSNYGIGGQGGALSYGLSEVEFSYIPTFAREPEPAAGAEDLDTTVDLSWRAGREAVTHEVSLGTDEQAVIDGLAVVGSTNMPNYTASSLALGATYYWKVNEVNTAEAVQSWAGNVWNFTTKPYLVVDDMESYSEEEGSEVYLTWLDGVELGDSGSVVGYNDPPYVETSTTHSGSQSMPVSYGQNTGFNVSTAERTYARAQDWTASGVTTLTLFFYGAAGNNPAEPMWIELADQSGKTGRVTYGTGPAESADNQAVASWHEWSIPLSQFGINLTQVTSMTIGFGGAGVETMGTVIFDDIRLYPPSSAPEAVLAGYWALNNNAQDGSGNGNDGTLENGPTWTTGKVGGALSLDGVDDYVDCGNGDSLNITDAVSLSVWVNMADAGNGQHNPFIAKGDRGYVIKHNTSNQFETFIYDGGWHTATYPVDNTWNGEWHHVASTYDGVKLRLYVDGILRTTTEYAGQIGITEYGVNLGRNSQNTDRLYNGLLDEARIYQGALSPADVAALAMP